MGGGQSRKTSTNASVAYRADDGGDEPDIGSPNLDELKTKIKKAQKIVDANGDEASASFVFDQLAERERANSLARQEKREDQLIEGISGSVIFVRQRLSTDLTGRRTSTAVGPGSATGDSLSGAIETHPSRERRSMSTGELEIRESIVNVQARARIRRHERGLEGKAIWNESLETLEQKIERDPFYFDKLLTARSQPSTSRRDQPQKHLQQIWNHELFKWCRKERQKHLTLAFEPMDYEPGATVIAEGDQINELAAMYGEYIVLLSSHCVFCTGRAHFSYVVILAGQPGVSLR